TPSSIYTLSLHDALPIWHPNSHQRMMSMEGSGDMKTEEQGEWRSNFLISQRDASLEERWISIPPNTWHRPVIGNETDWVVISFQDRKSTRLNSSYVAISY